MNIMSGVDDARDPKDNAREGSNSEWIDFPLDTPQPDAIERTGLGDGSRLISAPRLIGNPGISPISIEQYRRLAAVLHQAQVDRGIKSVMVTSAFAGEGKTLTAANL